MGFEWAIAMTILVNMVFMGYSTNFEMAHVNEATNESFAYIELIFTLLYALELYLRILSYGKSFFLGASRNWNMLDTMLVIHCIYEQVCFFANLEASGNNVSFLRVARLLKMAKMLRVIRLLRSMRQLRLLL